MLISIVYYVLDVFRYVFIFIEFYFKIFGCFIEDIRRIKEELLWRFIFWMF